MASLPLQDIGLSRDRVSQQPVRLRPAFLVRRTGGRNGGRRQERERTTADPNTLEHLPNDSRSVASQRNFGRRATGEGGRGTGDGGRKPTANGLSSAARFVVAHRPSPAARSI